ncbi:MAG: protein NosL [bacterium]|nr:protein NosL [bacterium]
MSEIIRRMSAAVGLTFLAACWQSPTTGPSKIHWDRQTCEHCQMVISEKRHAAQIRVPGESTAHAFDDLGCALLWLDEQAASSGEPRHEVWVRDPAETQWIDGHTAHFRGGMSTPMAYGFGTAQEGISLDVVRDRVREAERHRRSGTSETLSEEHSGDG